MAVPQGCGVWGILATGSTGKIGSCVTCSNNEEIKSAGPDPQATTFVTLNSLLAPPLRSRLRELSQALHVSGQVFKDLFFLSCDYAYVLLVFLSEIGSGT